MRGDQSDRMLGANGCPGLTWPTPAKYFQPRHGYQPNMDITPNGYHPATRDVHYGCDEMKWNNGIETVADPSRFCMPPSGGKPSAVHYDSRDMSECVEPSGCCPSACCQCSPRPHELPKVGIWLWMKACPLVATTGNTIVVPCHFDSPQFIEDQGFIKAPFVNFSISKFVDLTEDRSTC